MVASHLKQRDYTACVRVSQAWKQLFTPFIWRHIDIGHEKFRKMTQSDGLRTHGQWTQSIYLGGYEDLVKEFLEHSPERYPTLMNLSIPNPMCDSLIEDFIAKASPAGSGRGLRKLEISGFEGFADFAGGATDALLLHASTLEILRLDMMPCMSSEDIQQLLTSAPNLKEFDIAGGERDPDNDDMFLDARVMVSSEWVCTKLEIFACRIGGIPRPDITRLINRQPASGYVKSGTLEESMELHKGVYSQLARLTKLKELRLGARLKSTWGWSYESSERDRLYDCPAMSLASGMGVLKELKELETVCLNDMEVSVMRDKEEEWIKEHWPKVKGVSYDDPVEVSEDE
ncbi:hypothetical protein BGZ95_010888 [Linnemannia exigua]|uniref:F-box domain-containing protein n=1 Tax=Linnemannia exigua TaxID=604196 RepID=A0AAD4DB89_9FUNG|nr:hypothetical protein BGZ95_010888 [Linnemannia exigua]